MKIEPTSMANRYELAERLIWQNMANWKKAAIEAERAAGKAESHLLSDFAKEIISMAESEEFLGNPLTVPVKVV